MADDHGCSWSYYNIFLWKFRCSCFLHLVLSWYLYHAVVFYDFWIFNKTGGYSKKLLKSVLFPFIVFNVIYKLYEHMFNPEANMDWRSPGFAMWFLWVLFIYRLLFPVSVKIKHVLFLSVIVALLVGFVPQIRSEFALSRIFCFLPFYLLGYFVNNGESEAMQTIKTKILEPLNVKDAVVLTFTVIIWATLLFYKPQLAFLTTFNYSYNGQLLLLAVRAVMYLTACLIAFYVLRMFPNRITFYTKYGSRTMGVYLLHGIIILPFAYKVFQPFECESHSNQISMIIIPVLISLLLFSKPIDKIINKCF